MLSCFETQPQASLKESADQHEADCYEENGLNNVGQREGAERRVCALLLRQLGEVAIAILSRQVGCAA